MGIVSSIRTLLRLPTEYRREDFEKREKFREDYRRLAHILMGTVDFESVLDVGCANGFLIEELQAHGKRVAGIEASPEVQEVLPASLRDVVRLGDFELAEQDGARWDLVSCIEVAEHISPARTQDLVRSLVSAARSWIYFTAASHGQGGHGHINCRPKQEWLQAFARYGWWEDSNRLASLKRRLGELDEVPWLETNSTILSPEPRPVPGAVSGPGNLGITQSEPL